MSVDGIAAGSARIHEQLEGFVTRALADWRTPGLVISLVRGEDIVMSAGFGVCRTGSETMPDEHTRFAIGSLSKAFGAASVACLVDQRRIRWDDRVRSHLPWFELWDASVTDEVRVRDLLAHRVGSDFTVEERLVPVICNGEDFVRRIRHLPPGAAFRSKYVYSNGMYVAAGLLVEAVTGKPWAQFARESLWQPLGMARTTADVSGVLSEENHATPHWQAAGTLHPLDSWEAEREAFDISGPSGSVISTAADMAQWMQLQLGKGRYGGRQIITAPVFGEMHQPHTPIRGGLREVIYWFTHLESADIKSRHWAYGLGWWITDYRGRPMICHTGTAAGFRGAVLMLPEERLGVYVGVNVPTELPFVTALAALDKCLGYDDVDWSRVFLEQLREREAEWQERDRARAAARVTGTQPSLAFDAYAGTYCDDGALGSLEVRYASGELVLLLGHERGTLVHWHYDVFVLHWETPVPRQAFVTFDIDSWGTARELQVEGVGHFFRPGEP